MISWDLNHKRERSASLTALINSNYDMTDVNIAVASEGGIGDFMVSWTIKHSGELNRKKLINLIIAFEKRYAK
jgi:hypothetical protein